MSTEVPDSQKLKAGEVVVMTRDKGHKRAMEWYDLRD